MVDSETAYTILGDLTRIFSEVAETHLSALHSTFWF